MENLIIAGIVGRDAQLRRTQSGDPVLGFSVAVDQGKDRNGQKRDAKWYDASLWGKRAESLEAHITKGTKLVLQGRPTAREHEGKVYMGISVNELTFLGSGQQRQEDTGGSAQGANRGGAGGYGEVDDEIPF